ncbi:MAG: DUF1573 domain-containing protein [Phycisphaerales bacterium]|jgi:hypothetical protein|nr:DUF1573 domain-containing protein [Phycisphaerales bacterium]
MPASEDHRGGGIPGRVLLQIGGALVLAAALVALGTGAFDAETPRPPARVEAPSPAPKPATTPVATPPVETPTTPESSDREVQVKLDPPTYEFGFLRPQEARTRTLTLTNLDADPIRLKGTWRGCSCTTLGVSPGVLLPGQSIDVPATLTAGLTPTTKTSTVKLEVVGRPPIVLPVEGEIIRGVRARPRDIDTYRYRGPEGNYIPSGRIVIDAPEGPEFRVLSVNGRPVDSAAATQHVIPWDVGGWDATTGLNAAGEPIAEFWLVETDHPETPVLEIPVRHRANRPTPRGDRPWFFVEQRVNVGGIPSGGSGSFTLPIKWTGGKVGVDDTITGVSADSELFRADLISNEPDGRESQATILVTPLPGTEGPFQGTITIHGAAFDAELPVIGHAARVGPR